MARRAGRACRDKGLRGEREIVGIYRDTGFPLAARTPMSGGLDIKGDVGEVPYLHVEVKRCETLRIPAWMRQAVRDCPRESIPVVHYRQNRQPWMVVLRQADLFVTRGVAGVPYPPHEIRSRDGLVVLALADWLPLFAAYVTRRDRDKSVTASASSRPTSTSTRELKLSQGVPA